MGRCDKHGCEYVTREIGPEAPGKTVEDCPVCVDERRDMIAKLTAEVERLDAPKYFGPPHLTKRMARALRDAIAARDGWVSLDQTGDVCDYECFDSYKRAFVSLDRSVDDLTAGDLDAIGWMLKED